jgi:hypothetical protein
VIKENFSIPVIFGKRRNNNEFITVKFGEGVNPTLFNTDEYPQIVI